MQAAVLAAALFSILVLLTAPLAPSLPNLLLAFAQNSQSSTSNTKPGQQSTTFTFTEGKFKASISDTGGGGDFVVGESEGSFRPSSSFVKVSDSMFEATGKGEGKITLQALKILPPSDGGKCTYERIRANFELSGTLEYHVPTDAKQGKGELHVKLRPVGGIAVPIPLKDGDPNDCGKNYHLYYNPYLMCYEHVQIDIATGTFSNGRNVKKGPDAQLVESCGATLGGAPSYYCSSEDLKKANEVDKILARIIAYQESNGYPEAAKRFKHWRAGSGTPMPLDLGWLRESSDFTRGEKGLHLLYELNQYGTGKGKSLYNTAIKLREAGEAEMLFDDWQYLIERYNPLTDYGAAIGGAHIESEGLFMVTRQSLPETKYLVQGTVNYKLSDIFDFNEGDIFMSPVSPYFLPAKDLNLLQKCKGAKPFTQEVTWSQEVKQLVTLEQLRTIGQLKWIDKP